MNKIITYLACSILLVNTMYAQKMSLQRAIKFYKSKDLTRAEKEIQNAIQPPFVSIDEWAKASNYYVLIKADLRANKASLPENLHELTNILNVYSQCTRADKENKYIPGLKSKLEGIAQNLIDLSYPEYTEKHFDAYLTIMDFYVLITESIGRTHGEQYAYIAKASTKAGHNSRAIYYWHKVIDIGYRPDHAYKEMLSLLYGMQKYNEVDEMLIEARQSYPNSPLYGEVEVLRLMDKDLLFKAKKHAESIVDKYPNNMDVLFLLGLINSKFQDHDGALNSFLEVAHNDDDHFETHLELGKYFWDTRHEEGHLSLARHYLEKAENLIPMDTSLLTLLRNTYFELNDLNNYHRVALKMDSR